MPDVSSAAGGVGAACAQKKARRPQWASRMNRRGAPTN